MGGDFGWGLGGKLEPQGVDEHRQFLFRLGVTGQNHGAPVVGGQVDVNHLHRGELLQHRPGRKPGRQITQPPPQGHMQTVGQEGDEDVGFDAGLELVEDGADVQVALEVSEGLLDRDQQHVEFPKLGRIFLAEIGAKQVTAFPAASLAQFLAIDPEGEGLRGEGLPSLGQAQVHQTESPTGLGLGLAELERLSGNKCLILGRTVRVDGVVPFAVKRSPNQVKLGHFPLGDLGPGRVIP